MKFSIEAEQSVLGGLLIDPSKIDDVLDIISENDFYQGDNRFLFSSISRMASSGQAIDVITLAEALNADGKLEYVGGLQYLIDLHQNTPGSANIKAYAQIVADRSMERKILEAGQRICELGEADGDVDEKLNKLHSEIESLERSDDAGYVEFNSIIKSCMERLDRKFRGEAIDQTKTGFEQLDNRLVIEPTDFWVVAARPAMGKTVFAMNVAYNVAREGKEVLVFSMEMSKEQLMDRLLSAVSGLDSDLIRSGKFQEQDWSKLAAGVAKLKDLKIHIIEIPAIDINRALSIARKFQKKSKNVGLVVIDYLQLMTTTGEKRFDVVSEVSRKLKVMAKTIKAPVLALSQLSRKCEERANRRPMLQDLRESGQIEQDADIISFIYRDEYYFPDTPNKGTAEIITGKFRNGEIGTDILGTQFQFNRFVNIDFSHYRFDWGESKKGKRGFDD